ncbi:flagellar filament capping protein FliD [Colwellia sp. RE-S-Sl-9]
MNITQAGIGSGLDLESIIEAFVTAESVPQEIRLQEKEDRYNTELSGIGSLKSALSTFESSVNELKDIDNFNQQTVTVSGDNFSATTNGFATSGSFDVEVIQLAKSTKIQTTNFADSSTTVGAGTLTFNSANGDTFDVTIDAADDLSTIRDKINQGTGNFGVNVTLVNSDNGTFLTYTAADTGTDNALTVTSGDAALSGLSTSASEIVTADNAIIEVDGNVITNSTNEFKNNIEDVTIVATKVSDAGVTSKLDVTQDTSVANTLITDFVAGYNALVDNMIGLGAPVQGRLAFDADLRSMRGQLSDIAINQVASLAGNSIQSLNDIGISFNKEGRLEISTVATGSLKSGAEKLSDAISNDINGVGELFASTDGIVSQLTALIDNYNGGDGTLTKRQSALNENLSGIADEYTALETKLRDYEDTLRKRFSFLDSSVAQYNATSDWLTSALALPESNS